MNEFRFSMNKGKHRYGSIFNAKEERGKIVKIQRGYGSIKTFILDSGYKFDSEKDFKVGDTVVVKPFMMGTVTIEKV